MELCRLLDFKDFGDNRGKLVVIESSQDIPFDINVFFIYMALIRNLFADSTQIKKVGSFL